MHETFGNSGSYLKTQTLVLYLKKNFQTKNYFCASETTLGSLSPEYTVVFRSIIETLLQKYDKIV